MFNKGAFEAAILAEDITGIKQQLEYLFAEKGKFSDIAASIASGLVFAVEKKRRPSFDQLLGLEPYSRIKLRALTFATTPDRQYYFHRLLEGDRRPQDLVEVSKFCIRAGQSEPLTALFKQYGMDPETKVKPSKRSRSLVSLYDYARLQRPRGNLAGMEAHMAVMSAIFESIQAKRQAARAQLAAVAGSATGAPVLQTPAGA
jgi:hypothetical protein